ncbi:MAG: DUF3352 domain-containing protein [Thermoguttaceae bacterium]
MSSNFLVTRPGRCRRTILFAVMGLIVVGSPTWARAERPASPLLLPDTTVALLSVVNRPEMTEKFMHTALGRMSRNPQLKPLIGDLYGSLSEAMAGVEQRLGLPLDRLLAIPQGELTVAVVAREGARAAGVILCDVGDHLADARKMIDAATAGFDERGVDRTEETFGRTKLVCYKGIGLLNRKMAYFEKDATLVVGTDPEVLRQILSVWNGGGGNTLAKNGNFATIMQRCRVGGDQRPHLVGYVDPVAVARAAGQTNSGIQIGLAMLPLLGLDGLLGVGGTVTFDTEHYDMVTHAHVLLDSPRTGIPKMIALKSGDMLPESWVPDDAAGYMTLHWNVMESYTTAASVFDSIQGEGALAAMLQRRILGPTGIDFEKEVLEVLEGRVTRVSWIERPITPQSQSSILGLKLLDADAVTRTLQRVATEKKALIEQETYAGKTYYRIRSPQPEEAGDGPLPCFGVLDDYLLVANRPELYKKVLATARGSKSLADELDFKLVARLIRRQPGGQRPAMISFERPDQGMRFLYDLATGQSTRARLAAQGTNNRMFRALDTALKANPLPPFEVLRQYLAPTGALIVDDETGIHYTAFSLRRK